MLSIKSSGFGFEPEAVSTIWAFWPRAAASRAKISAAEPPIPWLAPVMIAFMLFSSQEWVAADWVVLFVVVKECPAREASR